MILSRRKFFIGLGALFAAPAIIPYERLMPVKAIVLPTNEFLIRFLATDGTVIHETNEANPYWSLGTDGAMLYEGVPLTCCIGSIEVARA